MTIPRIANRDARGYVQRREPFRGSNTLGVLDEGRYIVYSYGLHWPMFIWDDGQWYHNAEKYSCTTSKHHGQLHPLCECISKSAAEMREIAHLGVLGVATRRIMGASAYQAMVDAENEIDNDVTEAVTS